jgi:SAM-dependent MidA family methyltransferase
MTKLKERIFRQIEIGGPISISDYMALCLFDPEQGYYTTREPFGVKGDFTTAPEISQIFGELVAVWLYSAWSESGAPMPATIAEIGPGRGTMMADMLRTLNQIDPAFCARADFVMIEASPRLAEHQKQTLRNAPASPKWLNSVGDLKARPLYIIGNELFDAIPFRQFVKTESGWRERCIGVSEIGALMFTAGSAIPDPRLLPKGNEDAPAGSIAEISPQRFALMEEIGALISKHGGAGLFFDYGYVEPALGDSFQAMRAHKFVDALDNPGTADLTSHVDFSALANAAVNASLKSAVCSQGEFLLKMGLLERAGSLGADSSTKTQEKISASVERIAGDKGMGKLFKAFSVAPISLSVPPFSEPD